MSPTELAKIIAKKAGLRERRNFLPPNPDKLFKLLHVKGVKRREKIRDQAADFLRILQRLSDDERRLVCTIFYHGCPAELPVNIHINLDLLRRYTGFPRSKITRLLGKTRSLGFFCSVRTGKDAHDRYLGSSEDVALEWHCLWEKIGGNLTKMAAGMMKIATKGYCEECGILALERLDFSRLSSATFTQE